MTERRYLIFSISGRQYAFELSQVVEVCEPPSTWPIPFAPTCYRGAMNFHGAIVAVLELPVFMGIKGCSALDKLIVMDPKTASLGLMVEQVHRIVPESETEGFSARDDGFCCAVFMLAGEEILLLSPERIAARAAETINP